MPKKIPPESPEFCWAITQASYDNSVEQSNLIIRQRFPNAEIVEETSVRGWRCILVRHDDRLSVAFRGTDKWHNWLGNLWHEFLGAFSSTTRKFEKQMDLWESKYEIKIGLIAAHSGAAIHGSAVRKADNIARVFFNPHKTESNENHINLVTSEDLLSGLGLLTCGDPRREIEKMIVVGAGTHSLNSFKPYVTNRDWSHLQAENQRWQTQDLETYKKFLSSSIDYIDQLESGTLRLLPRDVKPLEENLEAKGAMIDKAEQSRDFLRNFEENTKALTSKIHRILDHSSLEKQKLKGYRQKARQMEKFGDAIRDKMNMRLDSNSYASISHALHMQRSPKMGLRLIEEVTELTRCYDQKVRRLIGDLNLTHHADEVIRAQFAQLDKMDKSQNAAYHELLKLQKSIGSKLRRLEMICAAISFVSSLHPSSRIISSIAMPIIETLPHYPRQLQAARLADKIEIYGGHLERNLDTKQRLVSSLERNKVSHDQFLQSTILTLDELIGNHSQLVPINYRRQLTDLSGAIRQEIEKYNGTINEINDKIEKANNTIQSHKQNCSNLVQNLARQKKSRKDRYTDEIHKLQSESAAIEATLREYEEGLKVEVQSRDLLQEQLDKAELELRRALDHSELRDRLWADVQVRSHWIGADTEKARAVRREMQSSSALYASAIAPEREMVYGLLGNVQNLAVACGYQGQAIHAITAGYQIFDQIHQWRSVAIPNAKHMIQTYNGNVGLAIIENVGACVSSFLNPAVGVVLAGVQLYNAIHSMMVKSREKSPFKVLLEEISKEIRSLDQGLRESFEKRSKDLETVVTRHLLELKETLNISASHICDKIDELREETQTESAKKRASDFVNNKQQMSQSHDFIFMQMLTDLHNLLVLNPISQILKIENNLPYHPTFDFRSDFSDSFNRKIMGIISLIQSGLDGYDSQNLLKTGELQFVLSDMFTPDVMLYSSGILSGKLGLNPKSLNWRDLARLSDKIISLVRVLERGQLFRAALMENNDLKKVIIDLCNQVSQKIGEVGIVCQQVEPLIKRLQDHKAKFFNASMKKIRNLPNGEIYLRSVAHRAVNQFQWNYFVQNLVAEKKFALHTELTTEFPIRMRTLRDRLEPRYKEYFQIDTKYTLCKAFTLGLWFAGQSNQSIHQSTYSTWWDKTWGSIQSPENLLTMSKSAALAPSVLKYQESLKTVSREKSLTQYQRGLQELATREYQLAFDLKKRRLAWGIPNRNGALVPLIRIKIDDSISNYGDVVSAYSEEAIKLIKETGGIPHINYRRSLHGLVRNYRAALIDLVESRPIDPNNPLAPLREGIIVPSLKENGIPLVFPRKLIKNLESCLKPTSTYIQAVHQGTLIPRYEFSTETRTLTIHYDIDSVSRPGKPYNFAKFNIGIFDPITTDSFKIDLSSKDPFDPSEFLIQTMYGNFAEIPLGLPGKKSVTLPGLQQIAPSEEPFEGLYRLWQSNPNRVIFYNSRFHEVGQEEPIPALPNRSEAGIANIQRDAARRFTSTPIVFQLGEDYMQVISAVEKEKNHLLETEDEYKNLFKLLEFVITLYSPSNKKDLLQRLEDEFELFPPERLHLLYEFGFIERPDDSKLKAFLRDVFATPSKDLLIFAHLQDSMENIIEWLSGTSDTLNLSSEDYYNTEDDGLLRTLEFLSPNRNHSLSREDRIRCGDHIYTIFNAVPNGANALHALLGSSDSGEVYQMVHCREAYVERFKLRYIDHKDEIDRLVGLLLELYRGSLASQQANYLFSSMESEFHTLDRLQKGAKGQPEIDTIYGNFFKNKEVQEKYLAACLQEDYPFSEFEIGVASHLFGKTTTLLKRNPLDTEYHSILYGPEDGESITIACTDHNYFRCSRESEFLDPLRDSEDRDDYKHQD